MNVDRTFALLLFKTETGSKILLLVPAVHFLTRKIGRMFPQQIGFPRNLFPAAVTQTFCVRLTERVRASFADTHVAIRNFPHATSMPVPRKSNASSAVSVLIYIKRTGKPSS